MRKAILILLVGLLLSGCTAGDKLVSSGKVYIGMTKQSWCSALYRASRPSDDACWHNATSRYLRDLNKEILWGPNKIIYHVFDNVTTPWTAWRSPGNGTLTGFYSNEEEALIAAGYYAEKNRKKAEEKKREEEREEERIAEEKKKPELVKKPDKKKPKEVNESDLIPIATGSGFFVSRDGYVVTNEHVAGICELMEIKIGGKKHNLNVVTVDRVNDLGLVKGNYKHPKYLEIDIEGAELGEEIVAMGYPLGKYTGAGVKITKGVVSSLTGPGNNFSEFQIDAAIGPGSSGGPIINRSGQVVGVAYGGINKLKAIKEQKHIPENVNFAISSQTLTNFLKANKVRYTKAYRDKKLETEKVAQIGDAATVKLYCLNTEAFYIALKKAESHTDVLLDLK